MPSSSPRSSTCPPTLFFTCSRWVAADGAAPTASHDPAYVALSESRRHAPRVRASPPPLYLRPPWNDNSSGTDESDDDEGHRGPQTRYISVIEADVRASAEDRPPKVLAIYEWALLDAFETKQYRRVTNTP
ncbi:hypothetical protein V8D89_012628 [Ganoderma adspersum]